jgi:hypothetical protein
MFCPKCGSRVRGLPPNSHCEQTRAQLSEGLRAGLVEECVTRTASTQTSRLSFLPGGTWFCPGCATVLEERDGRLSCPTCGACLNRFVHALVEFYVHPPVAHTNAGRSTDPLLRAALSGETEVARAISIHSPAMRSTRGASGESPAQLAIAAGHVGTAVALFRVESQSLPDDQDAADLLQRLMSEMSEAFACAGWLDDLEHLLWDVVNSTEKSTSVFSNLTQTARADLRWLAEQCHCWFRYGAEGPEPVNVESWRSLHELWRNAG